MKNTLLLFVIVATIAGCSKSKDEPPKEINGSITGMWKLEMTRADPGDGSGGWRNYTGDPVIIEFNTDGTYTDTRSNTYIRYEVNGDLITLYNNTFSSTFRLAVQELNTSTLAYYFGNGGWCGGPAGEQFIKLVPTPLD